MKYDVRLKIVNATDSLKEDIKIETDIIKTNHLPKIGEKINTMVFHNEITNFLVVDITNFYNDDFSEIDYKLIKLKFLK